MAQAKSGDKVRVHYTGTLEDGSIFDSSEIGSDECADDSCGCGGASREPLEFVIGEGNLLAKFEAAVIGLEPGQKSRVQIASGDAYGHRAEEMVAKIPRSEIPADINPEPGQQMEVILQDGTAMPVMVIEVSDDAITLDANHPLAGQDLTFDITLVEIL